MEGSPWSVAQTTVLNSTGRAGSLTSQMAKPLKFPWKTRLSRKARSEFTKVSPRVESNSAGLGE
ncbi:MAG: hypothetical protein KatS3mg081_1628 [Gemmatimonadales bacterium]|nr:MAG: hypothetical protein KatS3mg081_1628 [Gemmatimonadales bacterium]